MSHPSGWARCKLNARRLEQKDNLSALEESFLIVVEIRKAQIKFQEIQILAMTGLNEKNRDTLISMIGSYQTLCIGKPVKKESAHETRARKILAEETKKVFAVRPTSELKAMSDDVVKRSAQASSLMNYYKKNKKIYDHVKLTRR